jgi:negative regulator of sigma E activity
VSDTEAKVTRNIEEQLSAFLDGELPEAELQLLVRRLEKEPAYRATLARYVYMGSVMRDDSAGLFPNEFRANVMRAISDDQKNVAEPELAPTPRSYASAWSLAVAATIAFTAVGLSQFMPQEQRTTAEVFSTATATIDQPELQRNAMSPDRMTSYMVSHGEFSRGLQGTLVDSRIFVRPASLRLNYDD